MLVTSIRAWESESEQTESSSKQIWPYPRLRRVQSTQARQLFECLCWNFLSARATANVSTFCSARLVCVIFSLRKRTQLVPTHCTRFAHQMIASSPIFLFMFRLRRVSFEETNKNARQSNELGKVNKKGGNKGKMETKLKFGVSTWKLSASRIHRFNAAPNCRISPSIQRKGANNSVVPSGVFNSVYVSVIQTNLCSDWPRWDDKNRFRWLSGEQESKQNENQYEQQANKNSAKKNRQYRHWADSDVASVFLLLLFHRTEIEFNSTVWQ